MVRLDSVFSETPFNYEMLKKKIKDGREIRHEEKGVGSKKSCRSVRDRQNSGYNLELATSHPVELTELPQSFSRFTPFFYARFLVILTSFQLTFDTVNLQLFLELANGILKVASDFNFYHDSITSFVDGMTHLLIGSTGPYYIFICWPWLKV
jgi:hypothetical protein